MKALVPVGCLILGGQHLLKWEAYLPLGILQDHGHHKGILRESLDQFAWQEADIGGAVLPPRGLAQQNVRQLSILG